MTGGNTSGLSRHLTGDRFKHKERWDKHLASKKPNGEKMIDFFFLYSQKTKHFKCLT